MTLWEKALLDSQSLIKKFLKTKSNISKLQELSKQVCLSIRSYKNVFIAGNGGSHADALHFAEELTGRFRNDRAPIGALALGEATHVTCTANDYGFDEVFSRQLEGLGRRGDCFIVLSTSGNSLNLMKAVKKAKLKGIKTLALLGRDGGKLKDIVDLSIIVPGKTSDRIQELHMLLLHTLVEAIELEMYE